MTRAAASSLLTRGAAALGCLCLTLVLGACVSPHQNFKNIMQYQVGRSVDDPNAYGVRYPALRVGAKALPNGNTEEEFKGGRPKCRVFFEIDNKARKIVGWRYEGGKHDCAISP